jgi:hypothetical protein
MFEKWFSIGNSAEDSDKLAAMVNCDPSLLGQSGTFNKFQLQDQISRLGIPS